MYCAQCGKELPANTPTCPACGFVTTPPHSGPRARPGSLDEAVSELKRTAQELGRAAADFSERVVDKAGKVAKDAPGSARKASRRVADEVEKAAKEIDRVLRDL